MECATKRIKQLGYKVKVVTLYNGETFWFNTLLEFVASLEYRRYIGVKALRAMTDGLEQVGLYETNEIYISKVEKVNDNEK